MDETATRVSLRFFASAKAAIGENELSVELVRGSTIADALDAALAGARIAAPAGDDPHRRQAGARAVLDRCSFLVNGIATTDRGRTLDADDLIDVLPPFAGG